MTKIAHQAVRIALFFLICFVAYAPVSALPLSQEPVALYHFDGDTQDVSGNANHGVLHGNAVIVNENCPQGNCLKLDGDGDWVEVANSDSVDIKSNQITLMAWVKMDKDFTNDFGVVLKNQGGTYNYSLIIDEREIPSFRVVTATEGLVRMDVTSAPMQINQWYHVVVSYDGLKMRVYLDGALVSEQPQSGDIQSTTEPLLIGRRALGDDRFFSGWIDELTVWNRKLSQQEIFSIYNAQKPASAPNQAPVLDMISDMLVTEGAAVTFNPAATDPDGDPLIFTYSGWMTTNSYITKTGDVGAHTVTVTVSDGELSDSQVVNVKIREENIVPLDPNAPAPRLNFTDIISGPDTGLGDGKGSGAIVTLWGNNLGGIKDQIEAKFQASDGTVMNVAHIYYWKNADSLLPGGPANLYKSHKMQEIAVSIPDASQGLGKLFVVVNGVESNSLEFTIRAGTIKWVAPEGDNRDPCTFSRPCAWINGDISGGTNGLANNKLEQGDIVYSRGVQEPDMCGGGVCAGLFLRGARGTAESPISLIAYPGTRARIESANRGVNPYLSDHINVSKFHISVGIKDPDTPPDPGNSKESNYHIKSTKGRYVGNYLDEVEGKCFNGWSGSITSGGSGGDGVKIYGNHFYDLGCDNTSRFQHTLYMSIRDESATNVRAWEIGWNYLENNKSFYGIHNYDQSYSGDCGNLVGELSIHDNVIINQKGAGIHVSTKDLDGARNLCWTADISIYNNLLINTGLGPAADNNVTYAGAIRVSGDLGSKYLSIVNNTIYGFSDESSRLYSTPKAINIGFSLVVPTITLVNNHIHSFGDYEIIGTSETINNESNNEISTPALESSRQSSLKADICVLGNASLYCPPGSPVFDKGLNGVYSGLSKVDYDIYGAPRVKSDIGAIEHTEDHMKWLLLSP